MSPSDVRFWTLAHQRVAGLQSDVASALLRFYVGVRGSLSEAELARLIADGRLEQLIETSLSDQLLDRSAIPFRQRLRTTVEAGVKFTTRELPKMGKIDGTLAVHFDVLNPRVVDAVRELDTKVMTVLKADTRESVRAFVENGLRDGRAPRTIAREIRSVVGLAPNQEEAVRNYRRALEGDPNAGSPLARALRDKRFDATIKRGELTAKQVDSMTDAYRRKMLSFNANTNAKTATLDSYKLGQKLSWQQARENGAIPEGADLTKTWVTVGDARVRDEHVAMSGETVPFDSLYSNSEDIPGESTFNCRCLSRIKVVRAA